LLNGLRGKRASVREKRLIFFGIFRWGGDRHGAKTVAFAQKHFRQRQHEMFYRQH